MQSSSIAKIPEDAEMAGDHAILVSIPASTKAHNECEACSSPDWPHWHEAMQKEFDKLTCKHMWFIVDTPMDTNIIGSKWMYWLKRDTNGVIASYKACLVAQGFMQTYGID